MKGTPRADQVNQMYHRVQTMSTNQSTRLTITAKIIPSRNLGLICIPIFTHNDLFVLINLVLQVELRKGNDDFANQTFCISIILQGLLEGCNLHPYRLVIIDHLNDSTIFALITTKRSLLVVMKWSAGLLAEASKP